MSGGNQSGLGRLTFGQIEGFEKIPQQLKKGELTSKLRARLYAMYEPLFDRCITHDTWGHPYFTEEGKNWFRRYFLDVKGEFADNHLKDAAGVKNIIRTMFVSGSFVDVFNFIHFSLNIMNPVPKFLSPLDVILREELCAYRVVDGNRLVAIGSQEEAETISIAIDKASRCGALGARTHLRNAIDLLNGGDFAGSIRESISSVESIAKLLSSDSKSKLSDALDNLEKKSNIHRGMKAGFLSLYGYTSDEKGIRHALIEGEKPNVDEADALFMIGACSAFVTYLINRAADANLPVSADT